MDKTLNRLLPSFISASKPNGVLQPLKITLTLVSPDTILTTSPGYFSSSHKTATHSPSLNYFFQHPLELYLKHFIKENAMQNMKNAGIEKIPYKMFFSGENDTCFLTLICSFHLIVFASCVLP